MTNQCHGVELIEDAAEALGATHRGRPEGSTGHIGVFSFAGNKIITTSGGGMLASAEEALVQRAPHVAQLRLVPRGRQLTSVQMRNGGLNWSTQQAGRTLRMVSSNRASVEGGC